MIDCEELLKELLGVLDGDAREHENEAVRAYARELLEELKDALNAKKPEALRPRLSCVLMLFRCT